MKKILLAILAIFILTSCSEKVSEVFKKDDRYISLTQYTQRGQILNSLETVALINATYMNPVLGENNETKNNEVFIIGVYNSNDFRGYKKGGIHNPNYFLSMNDENYTKAIKANKVILDLTDYPFYNKWMKYYKVDFPKMDTNTFSIKYTNDTVGSVTLTIKDLRENK